MAKVALLFPGQGAQHVGMGRTIAEKYAAARALYDQAAEILGYDLAQVCFEGPAAKLDTTVVSQPAIFVTSLAALEMLRAENPQAAESCAMTAGLSLGEYTALHLAGAFSFEDGLRLVALRGKLMQEAAVASPSGMVAIIGGDEAAVRKICDEAAGGEVLVPANFNAPGQIVVSGTKAACERVVIAAGAARLAAKQLVVAGAFHSPLMQPAADRMKEALAGANIRQPSVPVYSNVTAQLHTDPESIKRLLVEQIVNPVRWEQTMTALASCGEARYIELAPGRTLAGLLKRINRRAVVEENAAWKVSQ